MFPMPFISPTVERPLSISYSGSGGSPSTPNSTSKSATGIPFGVAAPNRHIFCVVTWLRSGSTHPTLNSASIGGVSATIVRQVAQAPTSGFISGLAIISAVVPSGTSGTVSANFNLEVRDIAVLSYRVVDRKLSGTVGVQSIQFVENALNSWRALSVPVQKDGAVILGLIRSPSSSNDFVFAHEGYSQNASLVTFGADIIGGTSLISSTVSNYTLRWRMTQTPLSGVPMRSSAIAVSLR